MTSIYILKFLFEKIWLSGILWIYQLMYIYLEFSLFKTIFANSPVYIRHARNLQVHAITSFASKFRFWSRNVVRQESGQIRVL